MNKKYWAAALGCLLLMIFTRTAGAADNWWNQDWNYRVPVTADAGMNDRNDCLVFKDFDFGALLKQAGAKGNLDISSLRVIALDKDGKSQEIPVSLRKSPGYLPGKNEKITVIWKMSGLTSALDQRFYYLYFDSAANGTKSPSAAEAVDQNFRVPGENLVVNGDFSDGLNGWTYNSQNITLSDSVKNGDKNAVKITNWGALKSRVIPLEPGKKYSLSCRAKVEDAPKDFVLFVTTWLYSKGGQPGDIENHYKYQPRCLVTVGDWVEMEESNLGYLDKAGEWKVLDVTLPKTGEGRLDIYINGTGVCYVSDVKLVEIFADPVQVTIQPVEKKTL